nr:hypothetical protein [Brevundimonas diminuta]
MSLALPVMSDDVSVPAREALDVLQNLNSDPTAYRRAMTELGRLLGRLLSEQAFKQGDNVCLAMTVEDADYLGLGALEALETAGLNVSVVCFWNEREEAFGLDWAKLAPVTQEYVEPLDGVDQIVMLKSIISGSCVVRTNLEHLFDDISPSRVHVVAPVMLDGADERLTQEFPRELSERFQYWMFEVDTEREKNGDVVPGIGGEVYGRLGLGDQAAKNKVMPDLVRQRIGAAA